MMISQYVSCVERLLSRGGNTSNLLAHIRVNHPKQHLELRKTKETKGKKQQETGKTITIIESMNKSVLYARHSKKWQQITDSVAFSLAKDSLPLYTVEKPGFRKMLHTLDPRYELPSRKYFSNVAIPKMYEELKENVAKELVDVEYFSATSDLWSSTNMEPYLSFTVHFISNDWEIHNRCLQTLFCPSDHTAENLAEVLKESLQTWSLEQDRLSCILSDNGTNFTKAIRDLGWPHLSCFSHNLHLAVTSATRDDRQVSRALGLCRKLVGTFSHSWKKRRDLSKAQVDFDLPLC